MVKYAIIKKLLFNINNWILINRILGRVLLKSQDVPPTDTLRARQNGWLSEAMGADYASHWLNHAGW